MTSIVITEIERSGLTLLPSGRSVPSRSHIGPESARVIRRSVESAKPITACEVGLAFGISTLHILDVMQTLGQGKLIGMDPAQNDATWASAGLYNLERAGLRHRYEFHEDTSQRVLPQLHREGTRIQFAMIDGWHTFDHTLVDFFYADLMMDVGGIIVIDDVGYPSIGRMCDFVLANRDYEVFDRDINDTVGVALRVPAKKIIQWLLHPLVRDDKTPGLATQARQASLSHTRLIALRKTGHDRRAFDHFVAF